MYDPVDDEKPFAGRQVKRCCVRLAAPFDLIYEIVLRNETFAWMRRHPTIMLVVHRVAGFV